MIKQYLKYLLPYSAAFLTGRSDIGETVIDKPDQYLEYTDIINDDATSINYNKHVWDIYVTKDFFSYITLTLPDPVDSGPEF